MSFNYFFVDLSTARHFLEYFFIYVNHAPTSYEYQQQDILLTLHSYRRHKLSQYNGWKSPLSFERVIHFIKYGTDYLIIWLKVTLVNYKRTCVVGAFCTATAASPEFCGSPCRSGLLWMVAMLTGVKPKTWQVTFLVYLNIHFYWD